MDTNQTRFVPAICTKCGARITVDPTQDAAVCEFCGTPFIVERAINNYNSYVQNNIYNDNKTVNVQVGKRGFFDYLDRASERHHQRVLEEERRKREEEERKRAQTKKIWKTIGLVFLWLYGFPFMLTFTIAKSEKIQPPKLKYGLIIGVWIILLAYIMSAFFGGGSSTNSVSDIKTSTAVDEEISMTNSDAVVVDYGDERAFEEALNRGENLEGKVVRFKALELHPQSAYGYNVWAGEHLNFISSENPDIKEGDIVVVKAVNIKSELGSWFIEYEKIENAVDNTTTIFSEELEINPSSTTMDVSGERTAKNGFDIKTNKTFDYHGLSFSIPEYFGEPIRGDDDVVEFSLEKGHETTQVMLMRTDYNANSEKEFYAFSDLFIKGIIESFNEGTLISREQNTIAGFPSFDFKASYIVDNHPCKGFFEVIFTKPGEVVSFIFQQTDASTNDYSSDLEKILETASAIDK